MKFWITLFIFWAIFRGIKSAIEQSQKTGNTPIRSKGRGQVRRTVEWTAPEEPPRVARHEIEPDEEISQMDVFEGIRSAVKGDTSELERLFAEAKARKERIEGTPQQPHTQASRSRPVRPRTALPPRAKPQRVESRRAESLRAESRRAESLRAESREEDSWIPRQDLDPELHRERKGDVHMKARPKRQHVAVPRQAAPKPPAQAKQPKRRKPAKQAVAQAAPAAAIPLIGKLGREDIRRGIIMAELLGPPKALRDINSHVI
jgi:hypothetical protein